jgi:hypothetical protein
MKSIKLKIILILLMLIPVPFSCKEDCTLMGLYVQPYYQMQDLVFKYIDEYNVNAKTEKLMFKSISQKFDSIEYECQKMAMYFEVPGDALLFHSQNIKKGFSFTQEVIARCDEKQNGWKGTLEKVEKIDISSTFDYDDLHLAGYDLSDIVRIFAYTRNGENSWDDLDNYNSNAPYEAPKRFYLLINSPPSQSKEQQFSVRYYLMNEEGGRSKYFEVLTPVFKVKTSH